jgi:tetratricopeptide (TPR) repeat protein
LAPYFFIFHPLAKNGELGEMFLGITVLVWAVDLSTLSIERKQFSGFTSVLTGTGILLLAGIIAAGLTYKHSTRVTERLNVMASRDYFKREMYEQAQTIYTYIYQHPQYLMKSTRINHAKMLLATGEEAEATQILIETAMDLKAKVLQKGSNKIRFRRLGIIYLMLAESKLANNYFDKSIEVDQRKLALNPTLDEKAKLLFSISQTMEARGDIISAINSIEQANKYVQSAALRFRMEQRLKELVK